MVVFVFFHRWALARYDIDVFDCDTNETVKVKGAPLNTAVDIPEFDYSRKEVEVCSEFSNGYFRPLFNTATLRLTVVLQVC